MTTSADSSVSIAPGITVDELCDRLRREHRGDAETLCAFARLFFAKVPRALLQDRTPEQLAALVVGDFHFLQRARPEVVNVEVLNPEQEGWEAPVTLIRAEVGDRPFIVDTVREYLGAEGVAIQHYVYPVFRVERDGSGEITEVAEPTGGNLEALVHCEVSRIERAERREEIRAEIERRLRDVVEATSDFPEMLEALGATMAMVERFAQQFPERVDEFEETLNFLRWLKHDHFVFLGYRAYDIVGEGPDATLRVEPNSGLGILEDEAESAWAAGVPLSEVGEELRRRVLEGPLLIISKTNAESTVHRRARMDYIGIKKLNGEGRVIGERRFLGLLTSKAYTGDAQSIPIVRRKLEAILRASGARPGSHDYKETITIFNSMPKEDLFGAPVEQLAGEVQTVLGLLFTDEVKVALRPDPLRRGVSVMVILPRGKFSGEVRQRIQEALCRYSGGTVLNYHLAMSAGDQARLHFYLSAPPEGVQALDPREIEREIAGITRSWEERLRDGLVDLGETRDAGRLARLYASAFSNEYRAANPPSAAVHDVLHLERMQREEHSVAVHLRNPREGNDGFGKVSVLKLYLRGERLVLSDFMPILEDAGVRTIEIDTFGVNGPDLPPLMIYSFVVQEREGAQIPPERADLLAETLLAVRAGDAPADPFNALVLAAGLRWREVDLLRTYANYAFQIGAIPTRLSVARALVCYPVLTVLLLRLFQARLDPEGPAARGTDAVDGEVATLHREILHALENVSSLADDRAIRRLLNLIGATARTNYFRHGGADPTARSGGVPYISIKIRCADVEELRKSRLLFEVYVHSSRMEGIHLRGASVSRGGIRWSDRPDDFRTEIMGLVQTQIVKNAVIVPGGSKGGFITKREFASRDEMGREAAEQYRTLMRGMLDITDNLVDGRVVPPPGVVRHDGDDPYLVVAADKGTAHLSDTANAVAAEYNFWLGDAFASGGSQGYDHKEEGITARGGWECVRRHFREMNKDIQTEPFSVVGIGDMSGDVFGNGMLLSRQIRLLAAFDHRHIFLDPNPDPEVSFAERERLFGLPRSSWADYDTSTLSAGGMIVPRASKSVRITPEVRAALAIEDASPELDGESLIRAVLRAPVELLWNGGIGTYVKDADETHSEAGDSANDPVRVDAQELRCKVVGEGGNLGFTQQARVNYALRGGRINTDALDNSAGVDMSDHEVNLKILLSPPVTSGTMTLEERNRLLEGMTDEVSRLVLADNVGQSLAVSLDEIRSRESLGDFAALITAYEREGILERGSEELPSTETLNERSESGQGLTRPSLAVLLAFAKLRTKALLIASGLPDDPATEPYLVGYFPPQAVEAAGPEGLREHRLRREIVTTTLTSDLVDLMGSSFLRRMTRDSGSDTAAVVRAWLIASRVSGAAALRADLEALEGRFPSTTVYRWLLGLARVLERTTYWALANVAPDASTRAVVEENRDGLTRLRGEFVRLVTGQDRAIFMDRKRELQELGADETLAERLVTLRFLPELLDILRIAGETEADAIEAARAYYLASERFSCAELRQHLRLAAQGSVWEKRHAQTLVEDVGRAHRSITRMGLACAARGEDIEACMDEFERTHAREIDAYRELIAELRAGTDIPLAGFAIAARMLVGIAASG